MPCIVDGCRCCFVPEVLCCEQERRTRRPPDGEGDQSAYPSKLMYLVHSEGREWVCTACGHAFNLHVNQFFQPGPVAVPKKSYIDAWEGVGSLLPVRSDVEEDVYRRCDGRCVVTGRSKALKVAHIVPKKCFFNPQVLDLLEWKRHDLNFVPNLILLVEDLQATFDNLLWCFVPPYNKLAENLCHVCGLPDHLKLMCPQRGEEDVVRYVPFMTKEVQRDALTAYYETNWNHRVVYLPDSTSRGALYFHAWVAHERYGKLAEMPAPEKYTMERGTSDAQRVLPSLRIVEYLREQQQLHQASGQDTTN